jgi:hypothetical protein
MPPDQNFPSPAAGASSQQPYQLPSPYMTADMFKQSREQPFAGQGMGGNFNPQDFYQQEQLRQMANVSCNCEYTTVDSKGQKGTVFCLEYLA